MKIVYDRSDDVAAYLQRLFGYNRPFECVYALGVERDGAICGGVLFNNYWPERGRIEMTFGGEPGWVRRPIIAAALGYAFGDLRVDLILGHTRPGNRSIRALCRHVGADEVIIPHVGVDGEPEALLLLTWAAFKVSQFRERLNGLQS